MGCGQEKVSLNYNEMEKNHWENIEFYEKLLDKEIPIESDDDKEAASGFVTYHNELDKKFKEWNRESSGWFTVEKTGKLWAIKQDLDKANYYKEILEE